MASAPMRTRSHTAAIAPLDLSSLHIRVSTYSSVGDRRQMEDAMCISRPPEDKVPFPVAAFGVFDSHGGTAAAEYAQAHLDHYVTSEENFYSDDFQLVSHAICDGFVKLQRDMWRENENWPKYRDGRPSTAGTTASILFICRGRMYVGHVGDSRIVLGLQDPNSMSWRARQVTNDHKPESSMELQRIEAAGGKVSSHDNGIPRVVWFRTTMVEDEAGNRFMKTTETPFLGIARSLGDYWSFNPTTRQFIVSPVPDTALIEFSAPQRCLILATDGVWNVISSQEAVNIVYLATQKNAEELRKGTTGFVNPAKALVHRALRKYRIQGWDADNISAMVLTFNESIPGALTLVPEPLWLGITPETSPTPQQEETGPVNFNGIPPNPMSESAAFVNGEPGSPADAQTSDIRSPPSPKIEGRGPAESGENAPVTITHERGVKVASGPRPSPAGAEFRAKVRSLVKGAARASNQKVTEKVPPERPVTRNMTAAASKMEELQTSTECKMEQEPLDFESKINLAALALVENSKGGQSRRETTQLPLPETPAEEKEEPPAAAATTSKITPPTTKTTAPRMNLPTTKTAAELKESFSQVVSRILFRDGKSIPTASRTEVEREEKGSTSDAVPNEWQVVASRQPRKRKNVKVTQQAAKMMTEDQKNGQGSGAGGAPKDSQGPVVTSKEINRERSEFEKVVAPENSAKDWVRSRRGGGRPRKFVKVEERVAVQEPAAPNPESTVTVAGRNLRSTPNIPEASSSVQSPG